MNATIKLIEVLNDLIKINNDRIVGYEKAIEELKDASEDLLAIFRMHIDSSRHNLAQLKNCIQALGGEIDTGTTNMGKLYRAWMDIKANFTSNNRLTVLESCEFGEDAAQKAYADALSHDADMDADTRQIITKQKEELKSDHDAIKRYRDLNKAAK